MQNCITTATPNQIRARFDAETITVYQAYPDAIARAALKAGRFVPPFSLGRMTWIKPSFLWLMERSGWARKAGQENILAIRITRASWEEALSLGVLTHPEPSRYPDPEQWRAAFDAAPVKIQWDPERTITGTSLPQGSIQVGLSRHIIQHYVEEWTVDIEDVTLLARKIHTLKLAGETNAARKFLPDERVYPLPDALARHLLAATSRPSVANRPRATH